MADAPRSLESLLRDFLERSPLREGLREQDALARWPEIVGKEIARHSSVIALQDGVLLVRTDGSVWAQELSLLRPRIQRALEETLGKGAVKEIRFRTGAPEEGP